METIGLKISKIRKQKGMSQEELSDLSKINLRTLQRIEKDENQPSGNTLRLICETLQINIEEIINYGKEEDNTYLIFLHLSIISALIIPLGNIVSPLILWLNKRRNIINVDIQGKNILNFQIFFTIVNFVQLVLGAYGKISHSYNAAFFLYNYFILIAVNFIYAVYVAVKINKNEIKKFYPNLIIFIK
jgi:uncharacterized Tic20 family protein